MKLTDETTTQSGLSKAEGGLPEGAMSSNIVPHPHTRRLRPGRSESSLLYASVAVQLFVVAATLWLCGRVGAVEVNLAEHIKTISRRGVYDARPELAVRPRPDETSPEEGMLMEIPQLPIPAKIFKPKVYATRRHAARPRRTTRRRRAQRNGTRAPGRTTRRMSPISLIT